MTLSRRWLLSLALLLAPSVAGAVNPAEWVIEQSITPSTEEVLWTSPTAVDLGLANYLFSYEITEANATPIIGPTFSILDELGDLTTNSGASAIPAVLLDEHVEESLVGFMFAADMKIEVDAAGFGQASITNITFPGLLKSLQLTVNVTVEGLGFGDYDLDGDVDQADYTRWRSEYGGSGDLHSDGNLDGLVDAADYTVWRDNLGVGVAPDTVATSAPEPAALAGLALLLVGLANKRR